MIDKGNLLNFFVKLDEHLSAKGESEKHELIIYGGAALISMNILDRATVDIDVFEPELSVDLKKAVKEIAKENLYDENWLNSTGKAFSHEILPGWRSRTEKIFQGEFLTIKILGRQDLIFTKFLAELDRGEDIEDLKKLNPTQQEINNITSVLKALETDIAWSQKIDEIIKELLERKDE